MDPVTALLVLGLVAWAAGRLWPAAAAQADPGPSVQVVVVACVLLQDLDLHRGAGVTWPSLEAGQEALHRVDRNPRLPLLAPDPP